MEIGEVIRTQRKARGWKQQTLADRTGLAQAFISQVERGHRANLTMDVLRRFAEAFEVPLAQLIAQADTPPMDELEELIREIEQLGAPSATVASYRRMGHRLTEPEDRESVLVAIRGLRDVLLQRQPVPANHQEQPVSSEAAAQAAQERRSA